MCHLNMFTSVLLSPLNKRVLKLFSCLYYSRQNTFLWVHVRVRRACQWLWLSLYELINSLPLFTACEPLGDPPSPRTIYVLKRHQQQLQHQQVIMLRYVGNHGHGRSHTLIHYTHECTLKYTLKARMQIHVKILLWAAIVNNDRWISGNFLSLGRRLSVTQIPVNVLRSPRMM